VDERVGVQVKL